jgi:putative solute:sodium symporter small subunit
VHGGGRSSATTNPADDAKPFRTISKTTTNMRTGIDRRNVRTAECLMVRARQNGGNSMAANEQNREKHWSKTRNLTIVILIFWVIFSFVLPWNAHALNSTSFMGFPLGFYFTAQGSLIAFVLMIWIQNWFQDRIDDECGMHED